MLARPYGHVGWSPPTDTYIKWCHWSGAIQNAFAATFSNALFPFAENHRRENVADGTSQCAASRTVATHDATLNVSLFFEPPCRFEATTRGAHRARSDCRTYRCSTYHAVLTSLPTIPLQGGFVPDHFQFLHRSTHHWHLTTYSKCFVSSFLAYVFCSQSVRSTYLHSALPCNFPSSSLGAASGDGNSIETVLHLTRSGASVHFDISLAAIDLIPIARAAKVHYS